MKLSNWLRTNTSNWPVAATSMPATQDRSAVHTYVCRVSPVCALVLANAVNAPSSPMAYAVAVSCSIHQCQAFIYIVSDSLLVWNTMVFAAISL